MRHGRGRRGLQKQKDIVKFGTMSFSFVFLSSRFENDKPYRKSLPISLYNVMLKWSETERNISLNDFPFATSEKASQEQDKFERDAFKLLTNFFAYGSGLIRRVKAKSASTLE